LGIFLIKEFVQKTHTHIFLAILKKIANCLNLAREKSAEPDSLTGSFCYTGEILPKS
jgi:hypothetical protein